MRRKWSRTKPEVTSSRKPSWCPSGSTWPAHPGLAPPTQAWPLPLSPRPSLEKMLPRHLMGQKGQNQLVP